MDCKKNIKVMYYDDDLNKHINEEIDYKSGQHKITFYECTIKTRNVLKYIIELNYNVLEKDDFNGKKHICTRWIRLGKNINLMSKEELEEIESKMVMHKITN